MSIKEKRIKEILKPKVYKEFCKYMNGQTMDMEGIYDDDFLRFVKKLPVID